MKKELIIQFFFCCVIKKHMYNDIYEKEIYTKQ